MAKKRKSKKNPPSVIGADEIVGRIPESIRFEALKSMSRMPSKRDERRKKRREDKLDLRDKDTE